MPGIFDSITNLAGSEVEKAANLAHQTFQGGMDQHGHHGRAFIETLVRICRDHPNLVGIAVGVIIEQLLSEDKREFERRQLAAQALPAGPPAAATAAFPAGFPADPSAPPPALAGAAPVDPGSAPLAIPGQRHVNLHRIRPGRIAIEVFGGLLLLKFGAAIGHRFRRKHHQPDGWIIHASKIHLLSGTLAAYYFAKSLHSEKVSAWRNAAIALFATDALKPVLKHRPAKR